MNTLTPELRQIAQRIAGSTRDLGSPLRTRTTDTFRDAAVSELLADYETFAGWLQCARADRQQSDYYGPISNRELARIMLGINGATAEQRLAAVDELKARYVTEHATDIAARIVQLIGETE